MISAILMTYVKTVIVIENTLVIYYILFIIISIMIRMSNIVWLIVYGFRIDSPARLSKGREGKPVVFICHVRAERSDIILKDGF